MSPAWRGAWAIIGVLLTGVAMVIECGEVVDASSPNVAVTCQKKKKEKRGRK